MGIGTGQQQQGVGLPQAQPGPHRVIIGGQVDDKLKVGFQLLKTQPGVLDVRVNGDQCRAAEGLQAGAQLIDEGLGVHPGTVRNHREGFQGRPQRAALQTLRAFEPLHDQPGDVQQFRRPAVQQAVEGQSGPAQQLRIPQGNHRGIARLARDQGHLARRLAGGDTPQQPLPVMGVGSKRAQ